MSGGWYMRKWWSSPAEMKRDSSLKHPNVISGHSMILRHDITPDGITSTVWLVEDVLRDDGNSVLAPFPRKVTFSQLCAMIQDDA